MNIREILVILLFAVFGVDALSCQPCNDTECKVANRCSGSLVYDECGCCLECARQPGEKCGGPWNVIGRCDYGLACVAFPILPSSSRSLPKEEVHDSIHAYVHVFFDQRHGSCQVYYDDCSDVCDYMNDTNNNPIGFSTVGRSGILRNSKTRRGYTAYCDCTDKDEEAWMVIQRRTNFLETFDRTLIEYIAGFGNTDGDYWLGLDMMSQLTQSHPHELQIQVGYKDGSKIKNNYGVVRIGGQETQYQLIFDSDKLLVESDFIAMHNRMQFSTKDSDNDQWKTGECAKWYRGGWWYNRCTDFNVNGMYYDSQDNGPDGISWASTLGIEMVEMRIRPTEPSESVAGSGFYP